MERLESDAFESWPEPGLESCLGTNLGLGILRESDVSCKGRNKMSDSVKRTERWLSKYNLERVNQTLADLQGKMAEHCTAAMVGLCAMRGT
jgi:hypothetical protein